MESVDRLLRLQFPAQSEQLRRVRRRLREALRAIGCDAALTTACALAVDQAVSNIIRHAYGTTHSGDIILEIEHGDGLLVFRLTDFAPPVTVAAIQSRPLDEIRPGVLGVHLIRSIMDEVKHIPQPVRGNRLEMTKRISA
jgi:sigma-B regulation protein RsbU (phosphoserine phosphatase)